MTREQWEAQIAEYRTMCSGPEYCGHPEWHQLAEDCIAAQE